MGPVKSTSSPAVVSIGEILWDVVGNQRFIGGAPFNFAYHCQAQGARAAIISRVSADDLGADLKHRAESLGVLTKAIQQDSRYPTGLVMAETQSHGNVTYSFPDDCAWDHINFSDRDRELIDECSILCFGTLAQRNYVSRAAIMSAIANAPAEALIFYDLNLRVPYFSKEIITPGLDAATVLKVNVDELDQLRELYDLPADDESALQQLLIRHDLNIIVITMGADGAWAISPDASARVAGRNVTIGDTIGCGDAFGATFALALVRGKDLQSALESANLVGSLVAGQASATPHYTLADLSRYRTETTALPRQ